MANINENIENSVKNKLSSVPDVLSILGRDSDNMRLLEFFEKSMADINANTTKSNEDLSFSISDVLRVVCIENPTEIPMETSSSMPLSSKLKSNFELNLAGYSMELKALQTNLITLGEIFLKISDFDDKKQKSASSAVPKVGNDCENDGLSSVFSSNMMILVENRNKYLDCPKEVQKKAFEEARLLVTKLLKEHLTGKYSSMVQNYLRNSEKEHTLKEDIQRRFSEMMETLVENSNIYLNYFQRALLNSDEISYSIFIAIMMHLKKQLVFFKHIIPFVIFTTFSQQLIENYCSLVKCYTFFQFLNDNNCCFGRLYIQNLKSFLLQCLLDDYHKNETKKDHYLFRKKVAKSYVLLIWTHYPGSAFDSFVFFFTKLISSSAEFYTMYSSLCVIKEMGLPKRAAVFFSTNFKDLSSKLYKDRKDVKTYYELQDLYKNPPPLDYMTSVKRKLSSTLENVSKAKKKRFVFSINNQSYDQSLRLSIALETLKGKAEKLSKVKNQNQNMEAKSKQLSNETGRQENENMCFEKAAHQNYFFSVFNKVVQLKNGNTKKITCYSDMLWEEEYMKLCREELFDIVIKICLKFLPLKSKYSNENYDPHFIKSDSHILRKFITFYGCSLIKKLRSLIPDDALELNVLPNNTDITELLFELNNADENDGDEQDTLINMFNM